MEPRVAPRAFCIHFSVSSTRPAIVGGDSSYAPLTVRFCTGIILRANAATINAGWARCSEEAKLF